MEETTKTDRAAPLIGGDWTDPLEDGVRSRVRDFIETILEEELEAALGRARYERKSEGKKGYRNGHRDRESEASGRHRFETDAERHLRPGDGPRAPGPDRR